jgi:hypothetical protein
MRHWRCDGNGIDTASQVHATVSQIFDSMFCDQMIAEFEQLL